MRLRRLAWNSGQALVEYALLLALAALAIASALMILQGSLGNVMQASGRQIEPGADGQYGRPATVPSSSPR